ncbi:hypothetical protein Naga_100546g2 [Nannochloropsis gaditana]|uniref:Uncharacterized protein n=1 Tax=Nannochloropsis gaditana TaxID=72520 RepID=W7THT8_9STRA|nr:hypothetical protein Naga_100546g2 [Nannochloropsis gaditana]
MAWFNSKLRLLLEPINFNGGGQKQCYFSHSAPKASSQTCHCDRRPCCRTTRIMSWHRRQLQDAGDVLWFKLLILRERALYFSTSKGHIFGAIYSGRRNGID